ARFVHSRVLLATGQRASLALPQPGKRPCPVSWPRVLLGSTSFFPPVAARIVFRVPTPLECSEICHATHRLLRLGGNLCRRLCARWLQQTARATCRGRQSRSCRRRCRRQEARTAAAGCRRTG